MTSGDKASTSLDEVKLDTPVTTVDRHPEDVAAAVCGRARTCGAGRE